jgi:hypothetical protein
MKEIENGNQLPPFRGASSNEAGELEMAILNTPVGHTLC